MQKLLRQTTCLCLSISSYMTLNILLKLLVLFKNFVIFVESSLQTAKINDKHLHLRSLFLFIWDSCKIIVPWPVWPWWYSVLLYFGSCFLRPHSESSHFSTLGYLRYFKLCCPRLSSFFFLYSSCSQTCTSPHGVFYLFLSIYLSLPDFHFYRFSRFTGLTPSLSNSLAYLPFPCLKHFSQFFIYNMAWYRENLCNRVYWSSS